MGALRSPGRQNIGAGGRVLIYAAGKHAINRIDNLDHSCDVIRKPVVKNINKKKQYLVVSTLTIKTVLIYSIFA